MSKLPVILEQFAAGDTSLRPQTVKESLARVLLPLLSSATPLQAASGGLKHSRRKLGAQKTWVSRRAARDVPYTENLHIQGKPREVSDLYQRLDQFCLALKPGAIEKPYLAKCITDREGKRTFCSVCLLQRGMRIWLKTKFHRLTNPPHFARDVSAIGHWGVGDVELAVTNLQQFREAEGLIRQCFQET